MPTGIARRTLGFGIAGVVMAATLAPAGAAPVLFNNAMTASVPAAPVTEVRWRGWPIAAGVGAGLALGALAASQPYYGYSPYYYGYGPTYYDGPTYYEPYYGSAYPYGYYPSYQSNYYYQGRRDTNATNNW